MQDLLEEARSWFAYSQSIRRDLHQHPELGFRERRTAGIVAHELSQLGLEVTTGVAETGVVAMLEGIQPGPVALLRFDMDALPIQEETGAEYASLNPGVMHACGHDGHVAIGLTAARMLVNHRDQIRGAVKFVFQPAEEGMGGAEGMINAGILENPRVDFALAQHVWNERPVGWVGVTGGALMAGADIFDVRIEGKGGHGAIPHETVDPLVTAAQIVTALQTIVSRNVSPLDTAVVSVGRLRAGDAFNVIPQYAEFTGTFRTYDPVVRQRVVERFTSIVNSIAEAYGCKPTIAIQRLTPSLNNNSEISDQVRVAINEIPSLTIESGYRSMVSEDMAFILEKIPGCFVMVGSMNTERGLNYGHHHPKFDFDEAALSNAAAVITAAALKLLAI